MIAIASSSNVPFGSLIPITNRPPFPYTLKFRLNGFFSRSHRECRVLPKLWENVMEVKYNDKYMENDQDKDRQRQEWQRIKNLLK